MTLTVLLIWTIWLDLKNNYKNEEITIFFCHIKFIILLNKKYFIVQIKKLFFNLKKNFRFSRKFNNLLKIFFF